MDIRIFSEYIAILLKNSGLEDKKRDNDGCFLKIQELVSKVFVNPSNADGKVFVPEKTKISSLYKVKFNRESAAKYQRTLLSLLEEKGYNIDLLSRTSDYRKNCDYVDMRNKYVHPDHNMDAAEALAELGNIKKQTTSRLGCKCQ